MAVATAARHFRRFKGREPCHRGYAPCCRFWPCCWYQPAAQADVITDWNAKAEAIGIEKRLQPPPNARGMALMHTAMFEAVNAVPPLFLLPTETCCRSGHLARRGGGRRGARRADRAVPRPAGEPRFDSQGLAGPAGRGRCQDQRRRTRPQSRGRILALRANDGIAAPESYRPVTAAGVYVPTVVPVSSTIGQLAPWVMSSGDEFRPGAAAGAHLADLDRRRQRDPRDRRPARQAHRRADRDRPLLGADRAALLEPDRPPARRRQEARPHRQRAAVRAGCAGHGRRFVAVFEAKYHYNLWRP